MRLKFYDVDLPAVDMKLSENERLLDVLNRDEPMNFIGELESEHLPIIGDFVCAELKEEGVHVKVLEREFDFKNGIVMYQVELADQMEKNTQRYKISGV